MGVVFCTAARDSDDGKGPERGGDARAAVKDTAFPLVRDFHGGGDARITSGGVRETKPAGGSDPLLVNIAKILCTWKGLHHLSHVKVDAVRV